MVQLIIEGLGYLADTSRCTYFNTPIWGHIHYVKSVSSCPCLESYKLIGDTYYVTCVDHNQHQTMRLRARDESKQQRGER